MTEEIPYPTFNDARVAIELSQGRLPSPPGDPETLSAIEHQIRSLCAASWNMDPLKRPATDALLKHLYTANFLSNKFCIQSINEVGKESAIAWMPTATKQGSRWTAFFNPNLKQISDIELMHTLKMKR